ncbi:MAG: peptidoglycan-associated lipoprotein Pal [Gammaproteobacteria bacterium]
MTTRLLTFLLLTGLLAACGTTQETEQDAATVEDRSTRAGTAGESGEDDEYSRTYGTGEDARGSFAELDDPGSILATRTVYFDYDSSDIRDEYRDVVAAHAEYLAANPDLNVSLEGHADERGSREYNLALGERRALSVKQQMMVLGARSDQIRVTSYGEERPAVEGTGESVWSQNRRVEILY